MAEKTKKRAPTRAEKQETTRQNLLHAAAEQVGIHGYAGASIHKITTAADIANGTFYNYFESQQDLFDKLLPAMGDDLLEAIREAIKGETDDLRREELGFRAFFDYLANNPAFYRVLNEAETFAPNAYRNHMENMASSYLRALQHGQEKGQLKGYSQRELEVIVYILVSARNYLSYRYCFQNGKVGRLPDWITRAYMKFVWGGVSYGDDNAKGRPIKGDAETRHAVYLRQGTGEGWLQMSMEIFDHHLDDYGYIERGIITGLIDRTGTELAGEGRDGAPQVTSLSVNFARASHVRTLVARATCNAVIDDTAHISVHVHEQDMDGHLVATAMLSVTLART